MSYGYGTAPSAEDVQKYKESLKKAKKRIRERFQFVYSEIQGMSDDQLKAVGLMLTSVLMQETKTDTVKQIHYYNGWVMGALGSRSDGDFIIYPEDAFPHWKEEDEGEGESLDEAVSGHAPGQYM